MSGGGASSPLPAMNLCWNGIVKNESARIERCVNSLLPYVSCAIVVDTGSTDGTPDLITRLFEAAGKPVEIYSAEFIDFSQARNEALRVARASALFYEYLLFVDADMELVAERPDWLNGASGMAYDMRQVAGGVSYWNRRLLARWAPGRYVGPTHEYLDVPSSGQINGSFFRDHADGANRPGKLERDIALLQREIDIETRPGLLARYHFYLANSYFDLGDWENAAIHYQRRVELGDWAEEQWNAQVRYAHCLANKGDPAGFLWQLLRAFEMRPQRMEALYDLAKFFRERGANHSSLLFSEPGVRAERPADILFVNDYVYSTGLKEEFSICAYYDPKRRKRGGVMTNDLALNPAGTPTARQQARANMFWYLEPLSERVKSFKATKLAFEPPAGYVGMNPSVINSAGRPVILVRAVNYAITPEGRYVSRTDPGSSVIRTRNFIMCLDGAYSVMRQDEILMPKSLPAPEFDLVLGFEDSRLFEWRDGLWTLSTVRQLTREGWCEQVLAQVLYTKEGLHYSDEWQQILPKDRLHEKNWMPWVRDKDDLRFVYRLGAVADIYGSIQFHRSALDVGHISGGSQVIAVEPKLYMAIVHEAGTIPGRSNRYYQHRFALLRSDGHLMSLSDPFFFHDRQIEFAAGLALFGKDELMVSYGIRDEEAWIGTMSLAEVMAGMA
jgi:glycosyltransferase involved in cell wall biosynthesis